MAKAIRVLNLVLGSKRCLPKQELSSSKRQLNSSLFVGFPFGRRTLFLHFSLKKALPQRRQPFFTFLLFYLFTFKRRQPFFTFLLFYLFTFNYIPASAAPRWRCRSLESRRLCRPTRRRGRAQASSHEAPRSLSRCYRSRPGSVTSDSHAS